MPQKQITLGDQSISYTVRKSRRARLMRLAVHAGGSVVFTSPAWMSGAMAENAAEKFLRKKADWLLSKIKYFANPLARPRTSPLAGHRGRRDYLKYKEVARAFVVQRIAELNQNSAYGYGFLYQKISIKNQKTCWGSCSRRGNLNFNYKILFLPPAVQDYVLVHELCHLQELNHSPRFWALVARAVPDHPAARMEVHDARYISDHDFMRTIPIKTMGVQTTDFGITPQKKNMLYESGKEAAAKFFET